MEQESIGENYLFRIDLDTTNTFVAVATGKGLPVICNFDGKYKLLSVVTFSSECVYIGHAAVQHEDLMRSKNAIRYAKRLMGRTVAEIADRSEEKLISYDYKAEKTDNVVVNVSFLA